MDMEDARVSRENSLTNYMCAAETGKSKEEQHQLPSWTNVSKLWWTDEDQEVNANLAGQLVVSL